MEYAIEKLTSNFDQIEPLLALHWAEIANNRDVVKLNPDWEKYAKIDASGLVTFFTVRDGGRLVGYSLFITFPLLHYKDVITATNDIIFLLPEYRKGTCGTRLIKMCHDELMKSGVDKILWHVKPHSDWSPILERMGYKLEEKIFGFLNRKAG